MIRFSILLALITTMRCCAQLPEPDPTLWDGGAMNPSGEFAVPVFAYNPATGVMSVDTRGFDGVRTTTEPDQIAGDDVGLIALTIVGPGEWQTMDVNGFMANTDIGGAVVWSRTLLIKPHMYGVGVGAEYLEPGVWDIFQFDSGLTSSDFGRVEVAVNFASGVPGATIFGSVQMVPEPTGLALSMIFPGVLLLLARRKSERQGASRRYGDVANGRLAPSRSQQNELFIPMEQLG